MKIEKINSYLARDQFIVEVITDKNISALRTSIQLIKKEYEEVLISEEKNVREEGGLHVIGTERHESRRVDNQLRGRAGRPVSYTHLRAHET